MRVESTNPLNVLFCYAPEDYDWYQRLDSHLSGLQQRNLIKLWDANEIPVGRERSVERLKLLNNADIILLFISPDFLKLYYHNMEDALTLQEAGKARVIPLLVRPVDSEGEPFQSLSCLPKNEIPITEWENSDQALKDVARGLRLVAAELRESSQKPHSPSHEDPRSDDAELQTLPQVSTIPLPSIACPFIAGPMITNPSLFIGRKDLLQTMTTLMTGPQSTSINIIGERRIGKSSLLYHFYQTWEQRVAQTNQYVVLYLSLQEARCHTQQSFYRSVTKGLLQHPQVQANAQLKKGLNTPVPSSSTFADLCDRWKQVQVLPVLCLDEFEAWLKHPQEFDDAFFDHLRSLMNNNTLMLIIASLRPLDEYSKQHQLTSPFFNLGRQLRLEAFSDEDVTALLRLPASTTPGMQEALNLDEQYIARRWGDHHPYLLQMAASLLWQARQQGKNQRWAQMQFERERKRIFPTSWWYSWAKPFSWLVERLPKALGNWIQWVGGTVDDLKKWGLGMITLLFLIVLVISVFFPQSILAHLLIKIGHWFKLLWGM